MKDAEAVAAGTSPIAAALGEDFNNLHPSVRGHYAARAIEASGTMDEVYVKTIVKPVALLSYMLFHAPVPYGGRDVEITLRNQIDDSGTMHWERTFVENAEFRETVEFTSHMVRSGDHRLIEFTRYGLGAEAEVSVDEHGSLVYETRHYVIRLPFLGLVVRLPTWLSPFGDGLTKEIGEAGGGFRVEFEMTHPLFGRTLGYNGSCRIESA